MSDLVKIRPGMVLLSMHPVCPYLVNKDGTISTMAKAPGTIQYEESSQTWGTVIGLGPNMITDYDAEIEPPCALDDFVMVTQYSPQEVHLIGIGTFGLVRFGEVMLIVEKGTALHDKMKDFIDKVRELREDWVPPKEEEVVEYEATATAGNVEPVAKKDDKPRIIRAVGPLPPHGFPPKKGH